MLPLSKNDPYNDLTSGSGVSPFYEDSGLFRTALCDMMLELVPLTNRNDRKDLIVRGFVDRKNEIDVLFAGRRAAYVGPLEEQLKALMGKARHQSRLREAAPPDVSKIRLPIRVEGAWRRTLHRDDSGWETGTYHFVVARWCLLDKNGETVTYGEAPVVATPR